MSKRTETFDAKLLAYQEEQEELLASLIAAQTTDRSWADTDKVSAISVAAQKVNVAKGIRRNCFGVTIAEVRAVLDMYIQHEQNNINGVNGGEFEGLKLEMAKARRAIALHINNELWATS